MLGFVGTFLSHALVLGRLPSSGDNCLGFVAGKTHGLSGTGSPLRSSCTQLVVLSSTKVLNNGFCIPTDKSVKLNKSLSGWLPDNIG